MKAVYTADDPIQAHIVKSFLEVAGIPAVVVGEDLFPLRGTGASMALLPEVWVIDAKDVPRARKLIEGHEAPAYHPAPLWVRCVALVLLLWPFAVLVLPFLLRRRRA